MRKYVSFEYFLFKVLRSKNRLHTVMDFKNTANYKTIETFMPKILSQKKLREFIYPKPIFRKYSDFCSNGVSSFNGKSLETEIHWNACLLVGHLEIIRKFVALRDKYSKAILSSDYSSAISILDDIESETGYSYWLIENKLAILGLFEGVSKQSKYMHDIESEITEESQFYNIYKNIRNRCMPSTSSHQYFNGIRETTEEACDAGQSSLYGYVEYKLNFLLTNKAMNLTDILTHESASPVVDLYQTFVRISQINSIVEDDPVRLAMVSKSIEYLYSQVDDYLLKNMCSAGGQFESDNNTQETIFALVDEYTVGNYVNVVNLYKKVMESEPEALYVLELVAKSYHFQGLDIDDENRAELNISQKILKWMVSILNRDSMYNEARDNLTKIVYMFHHIGSVSWIYNFLFKECSYEFMHDAINLEHFSILNNRYANPLRSKVKNLSSDINLSHSMTGKFIQHYVDGDIDAIEQLPINCYRKKEYIVKSLLLHREYDGIDCHISSLLESDITYYQNRAHAYQINKLIDSGQVIEAIDVATSVYIDNSNLKDLLPIARIIEISSNIDSRDLLGGISFLILYDVYVKGGGVDKGSKIFTYFERFCFYNGVCRPLDILGNPEFSEEKKHYFLKYICTPEIIEVLDEVDDEEESYLERIRICRKLIDIEKECGHDSGSEKIYKMEIDELTENIFISKAASKVIGGKISINTEMILQNNKEKYELLLNGVLGSKSVPGSKRDAYQIGFLDDDLDQEIIFSKFVKSLVSDYLYDKSYGLETNLSMEFRHGKIAGVLSAPLKLKRLITEKDSNGRYEYNDYWRNYYGIIKAHRFDEVNDILSEFSRRVNSVIDTVQKKWCQIDKNNSFFEFDGVTHRLLYFKENLAFDTDKIEFCGLMFKTLDQYLKIQLNSSRQYLYYALNDLFTNAYDDLYRGVDAVKQLVLKELKSSILDCRTETDKSIHEICSWFNFSNTYECSDFNIKVPVKTALNTINEIYPHVDYELNDEFAINTNRLIDGKFLNGFFKVLMTALENTVKNSRLTTGLNVNICAKMDDNLATVIIENNFSGSICLETMRSELSVIAAKISNGEYKKHIATEGKSGLFKIKNILVNEIHSDVDPKFFVLEDKVFSIEIPFVLGKVIA